MAISYRQKLVEATQASVDPAEVDMRLTYAASVLLQVGEGLRSELRKSSR